MDIKKGRSEFFDHLWDHASDTFQLKFDYRRTLKDTEAKAVAAVVAAIREGKPEGEIANVIKKLLEDHPNDDLMAVFLQLAGLTRNKILTDLRASSQVAADKSVTVPSNYCLLHQRPIWKHAGPYLVKKLVIVFHSVAEIDPDCVVGAIEAVNQATYPGFIRQERAKRQGHEAESRLANLLASCNIPFEPEEKATNPLCRDATVSGVSFDIVIPSAEKPLVCFKATVHTANIGQYGESKDHLEVAEAIDVLTRDFSSSRPTLVAFIDGVGFKSNSAGLNGIIEKSDEFCQFRTIWKAVMISASVLDREDLFFELPKPEIAKFKEFISRWGMENYVIPAPARGRNHHRVLAGDAKILVRSP